jgi:hypothetical protein
MKIVGGPRNGQVISIAEHQGGPELIVPGMVLEYTFTQPGRVNIKMGMELDAKPSIPGMNSSQRERRRPSLHCRCPPKPIFLGLV